MPFVNSACDCVLGIVYGPDWLYSSTYDSAPGCSRKRMLKICLKTARENALRRIGGTELVRRKSKSYQALYLRAVLNQSLQSITEKAVDFRS
jgi:hypothetical protein